MKERDDYCHKIYEERRRRSQERDEKLAEEKRKSELEKDRYGKFRSRSELCIPSVDSFIL
jgi:hypothetical protein